MAISLINTNHLQGILIQSLSLSLAMAEADGNILFDWCPSSSTMQSKNSIKPATIAVRNDPSGDMSDEYTSFQGLNMFQAITRCNDWSIEIPRPSNSKSVFNSSISLTALSWFQAPFIIPKAASVHTGGPYHLSFWSTAYFSFPALSVAAVYNNAFDP